MIFLLFFFFIVGIFFGMIGVFIELIIFFFILGFGLYNGFFGDEVISIGVVVFVFFFIFRFIVCNVL